MALRTQQLPVLVLAMASLAAVIPLSAEAQGAPDWTYKVEVSGNLGNGQFWWGDSELGSGLDYGFAAGFRPFSGWAERLGLEFQAAWMEDSDAPSDQLSTTLSANLLAGSVLYHFRPRTRIQPYLLGGIGRLAADATSRCVDCVFDWDPATGDWVSRGVSESRDRGSEAAVTLGAGAKIAVQRHLWIRPEVLLASTAFGAAYEWSWVRVQVGLGVHF